MPSLPIPITLYIGRVDQAVSARLRKRLLEPKTKKGYISLGMSKRMSERISFFELTNERWVRDKFSTNEELRNPTPTISRISF